MHINVQKSCMFMELPHIYVACGEHHYHTGRTNCIGLSHPVGTYLLTSAPMGVVKLDMVSVQVLAVFTLYFCHVRIWRVP